MDHQAEEEHRKVDASLRQQINENLRRVYEETLNEGVPDRFVALLEKLRAREQAAPPQSDKPHSDKEHTDKEHTDKEHTGEGSGEGSHE